MWKHCVPYRISPDWQERKTSANSLKREFEKSSTALEKAFWSPEAKSYAFAIKPDNQRNDEASVLTTVPMWFGLADASNADATITKLAAEDHQADWGMRIISKQSKVYDGSGYHFGAVWPLFTGWASVAEYRYHRVFPAYANLRANALLGVDGALGHFTEVLSGDYYQSFATSSPHQIWSAAMVISPVLRGMFGLQINAEKKEVTLAPHVPADWGSFAMHNVRVGAAAVEFQYRKTGDNIMLETTRTGTGDCWAEFSPAISLRADVLSVELNGRSVPFKVVPNHNDQHVSVRFPVSGRPNNLVIRLRNEFGLVLSNDLPPLGSASRGLRVLSESWNGAKNQLTLDVSGRSGFQYQFAVWNPGQISSVEGGNLAKSGKLEIKMPDSGAESYVTQKLVIHFGH